MPCRIHGRKSAHRMSTFSTPFRLLLVETSYISPEPKQCSECKVLCCLTHIIPYFPPFMGENLNVRRTGPSLRLFFRGKGKQCLYFILHGTRRNLTRRVGDCCQCENVANSSVANGQLRPYDLRPYDLATF